MTQWNASCGCAKVKRLGLKLRLTKRKVEVIKEINNVFGTNVSEQLIWSSFYNADSITVPSSHLTGCLSKQCIVNSLFISRIETNSAPSMRHNVLTYDVAIVQWKEIVNVLQLATCFDFSSCMPVHNLFIILVIILLSSQDHHLWRRSAGELVIQLQLLHSLLVTDWCCIYSMVPNWINTDTQCCIHYTFTSTHSSQCRGEDFPPGCDGEMEIRKVRAMERTKKKSYICLSALC